MDLSLDDDQQAIQELYATFLSRECPPTVVREKAPHGVGAMQGVFQLLAAGDVRYLPAPNHALKSVRRLLRPDFDNERLRVGLIDTHAVSI